MEKFFDVKFNAKSESKSEKYETLQLLKILYDCNDKCQVRLGDLLKISFFRSQLTLLEV